MEIINLENVNSKLLGKRVEFFETIDSTQKEIWRRIENSTFENGTVIIAKNQTDGIGTHGRKWYTNENSNIAFSFGLLFQNCNVKKLENLTVEIAEIFVKLFKDEYNVLLDIKKPNDLYINGKKVGGILTQSKLQGENVTSLVIGIGINTNQNEINEEIIDISTSIKKEFNKEIDNMLIISKFIIEIEKNLITRLGEF